MKNQLKTIVLFGSLAAFIVGVGALVAPAYLYLFGALALSVNLGAYWFSDRIVLRMHQAREVSAEDEAVLHAMVEELAQRAGIPKPRIFLIPEEQPNAFATGRAERGTEAGGLLVALVAPLAATLVQFGISRSREFLADETGARICGDPEALARALVKLEEAATVTAVEATPGTASLFIVNPFAAAETLSRWFSTHPRTEERVARLRALTAAMPCDPLVPRHLATSR